MCSCEVIRQSPQKSSSRDPPLVMMVFETRKGTIKMSPPITFAKSKVGSSNPSKGTGVLLAAHKSSEFSESSNSVKFRNFRNGKISFKNLRDIKETCDPVSHNTLAFLLCSLQLTMHFFLMRLERQICCFRERLHTKPFVTRSNEFVSLGPWAKRCKIYK